MPQITIAETTFERLQKIKRGNVDWEKILLPNGRVSIHIDEDVGDVLADMIDNDDYTIDGAINHLINKHTT